LYHAAPGAAFTAVGALGITFSAWATFLVIGMAAVLGNVDLMVAIGIGQLAMLVLPAIAARVTRRDARALGLARTRMRYVLAGLLVGASVWLVNLAIVSLFQLPDDTGGMKAAIDRPPLGVVLMVIAIAPAICEEVLFRGVLLRGFASQLHGWAAILLSSLLFSIYHLNLPQMVPTFVLGLVLAVIATRAGSVIPTMVAHALNNFIAVLVSRGELPVLANDANTGWIDRHPVVAVIAAGLVAIGGITLAVTGDEAA
jgi:sodium transport system permease protein